MSERQKLTQDMFRATVVSTVLGIRAGGKPVDAARRDELLAKCRAGEYVELEVDLLAYEQTDGVQNRNFVRFRDGAMMAIGRTGKNTPFLRDHMQEDTLARGGTIIESSTEKRDEASYAIRQTAKLTATWAVELALRDLLSTVSIGWNPTGPVVCSVCNAEIFTKCSHWRGDHLAEVEDDNGKKRLVRRADGPIVVEWVFDSAELVETSAVNVPAVPGAHIESIRAAMAQSDEESRKVNMEKLKTVLVTTLGLAATASEDEVADAVRGLIRDRDTLKKELALADGENKRLSGIVEKFQEGERKTEEDAFVRDALSSGRITLADEGAWRDLYQMSPERAKSRMAERKAGCATPVGQPRQSAVEPAPAPTSATTSTVLRDTLSRNGVDPDAALRFAKAFGAKTPEKTLAGELGLNEEA